MPKKIVEATVKVPDYPRARFMRNAPPGSVPAFIDVTCQVVGIYLEKQDDVTEACDLVRVDEKGELVWRTHHQSEIEARWQAKHEYELSENDWKTCS